MTQFIKKKKSTVIQEITIFDTIFCCIQTFLCRTAEKNIEVFRTLVGCTKFIYKPL